jgi:hypothetical protein
MRVSMHRGVGLVCNPASAVPGDPLWSLAAYLDPFCTPATTATAITSISATDPNSPMNPNVCYGGGTQLNQAACLAANAQAASEVAASDPSGQAAYNCSQGSSAFLCYLGVTDANGNVSGSGLLVLLALGFGAIFVVEGVVGKN